ncbi:hypothetical protein T06_743 [Trichinella sp. T6]|nr:hypothetical protein T06_743 [Trichinella sp. T6]
MAWLTGFFRFCKSLTLERRRANVNSKRTSLCMRNMEKCYASSIFNTSDASIEKIKICSFNKMRRKSYFSASRIKVQKFFCSRIWNLLNSKKKSFHTERVYDFHVLTVSTDVSFSIV